MKSFIKMFIASLLVVYGGSAFGAAAGEQQSLQAAYERAITQAEIFKKSFGNSLAKKNLRQIEPLIQKIIEVSKDLEVAATSGDSEKKYEIETYLQAITNYFCELIDDTVLYQQIGKSSTKLL